VLVSKKTKYTSFKVFLGYRSTCIRSCWYSN